jgi:hypothetical protein
MTPLRTALASLPLLLLAACGISSTPANPTPETPTEPETPVETPKVRFIAFGDAGRGNDNQLAVGAAMAQLCALKGCDFALETGDNFYNVGVDSTTDPQWQTAFEVPYKDLNIPIYATLGNHDNSQDIPGNSTGEGADQARGNHQVAYTTATGAGISGKWKLPARYHSFTAPLNATGAAAPIAEFFCLDSSPLTATFPIPTSAAYNYLTYGPTQLQWFQQALTNSKAKWTLAFAHHPYISNGSHGNAGTFEGLPAQPPSTSNGAPWKDLLDKSLCDMNVDLFIFGHDHDLEWLKPVSSCNDTTEFILTGAGSDVRTFGDATRNPAYWQQDNAQGFFWFEVTDTTLTGESYFFTDGKLPLDANGKPVPAFTRTITK